MGRPAPLGVQPEPDSSVIPFSASYKVVGTRAIFGLKPGSVGPLNLTEGQAQALIKAGHIEPASAAPEAEKKAPKEAASSTNSAVAETEKE